MKYLGLVQWTNRDKRGSAIAGVLPIVEIQKGGWRTVDVAEEFPSRGLVFWPNAENALEDSLISFRVESNAGQKDKFQAVEAKPVYEVLDLKQYGTAAEVRAALVEGVRSPGPVGTVRAMIWCKPDLLIGPVDLNRIDKGTVKLVGGNLPRLSAYSGAQIRPLIVERSERLLRVDDAVPSSFVDWDEDALVLRRALEAAVRVAKQSGSAPGQTKKQIEEAARALAAQGGGDALLDCYRLERALSIIENTEALARNGVDLVAQLRKHPAIKVSLDALEKQVRTDVEQSARANLEQVLAHERTTLKETTDARVQAMLEFEASEKELRKIEGQLADARAKAESAAKTLEAAVNARLVSAIDRPLDLLAEVSVLRPFLSSGQNLAISGAPTFIPSEVDWSRSRGDAIKDKLALRRALVGAARIRGVEPELMIQVHAAVIARLMPITLGPAAIGALTAYAHAACAGRMLIVHVSPSVILPRDLDEGPGGGLLAAASAAKDIDGISLVVLEGANRAPLEGAVVPLLQLMEIGMSQLATAGGLRLAASLVTGATTVPVTPQVWSNAAVIYPEPSTPSEQPEIPGNLSLSSDLLVPGDIPTGVLDALLDAWPDCSELRPAMSRFGAALARLHDNEQQIKKALLHGLVLPYVATALTQEEQTEAIDKAGDPDGAIARALRRLRRRLA